MWEQTAQTGEKAIVDVRARLNYTRYKNTTNISME